MHVVQNTDFLYGQLSIEEHQFIYHNRRVSTIMDRVESS